MVWAGIVHLQRTPGGTLRAIRACVQPAQELFFMRAHSPIILRFGGRSQWRWMIPELGDTQSSGTRSIWKSTVLPPRYMVSLLPEGSSRLLALCRSGEVWECFYRLETKELCNMEPEYSLAGAWR